MNISINADLEVTQFQLPKNTSAKKIAMNWSSTFHSYFLPKTSDESEAAATTCKCLLIIVKQQPYKFKEKKLNLKAQPILEVKLKATKLK